MSRCRLNAHIKYECVNRIPHIPTLICVTNSLGIRKWIPLKTQFLRIVLGWKPRNLCLRCMPCTNALGIRKWIAPLAAPNPLSGRPRVFWNGFKKKVWTLFRLPILANEAFYILNMGMILANDAFYILHMGMILANEVLIMSMILSN